MDDVLAGLAYLGPTIALLNLALHLLVLRCIVRQLRWPYPFGTWTRAWIALLVAWSGILVFRIADLFAPPTYWRMLLACPMTLGLWYGMHQLAMIFRTGSLDASPPD